MLDIKNFVLDTNILIQFPNAIFGFSDNYVHVSKITLQELDNKKNDMGETGYKAREAIRTIYRIGEKGSYTEGIEITDEGGKFFVISSCGKKKYLPQEYADLKNDNIILNDVAHLGEVTGRETILVTNDLAMSISARALGIQTQQYKNAAVADVSSYSGKRCIEVPPGYEETIDAFYKHKNVPRSLLEFLKGEDFVENEYVIFKSQGGSRSVVTAYRQEAFCGISFDKRPFHIEGKSVTSKLAIHALMDESIPLVVLKGPAGCGKTFLSLACGLDKVFDEVYDRVMITRTNTLSDADLGFLPGDLEEKMSPLIAPFFDNLKVILKGKEDEDKSIVQTEMLDLFECGKIEIASMAYMRGRSLTDTFLIIDEAQNATPGQILEIVTRAGTGTKIVVCGDPDQIDNPRLDSRNNGLVFAAERMKGSVHCAQLAFSNEETVRSKLATDAAKRMKI